MSRIREWTCGPHDEGQRLDRFMAERMPGVSRGRLRRWIELGGVYLNGRRVRVASRPMRRGAVVRLVPCDDAVIFSVDAAALLLEDEGLLAVDKPGGVPSQPTPGQYRGCVYEAVLRFLKQRGVPRPSVGMPQRLDRPVSGVMLLSIARMVHQGLTEAFRRRRVRKTYRALCRETPAGRDRPAEGVLDQALARGRGRKPVVVSARGRPARTLYRTLSRRGDLRLVELEPVTGRMHQIRVHLAEAGLPILGDGIYGGGTAPRLMLHAARLRLDHPVTGRPLDIVSPLPEALDPDRFDVF